MELNIVGKVAVTAKIENLQDLHGVRLGAIRTEQVRSLVVNDALVDTGAMMLSLPRDLIDQLGLERYRTRRFRTANGIIDSAICQAVRLTIQDRDCTMDVAELPNGCPVLIGQLPLEAMDFVVDPVGQRLIGNPEHGGEQMVDVF